MKLRAITAGVNLGYPLAQSKIAKIAQFLLHAKESFQDAGYDVQTTRISTQPWPVYLGRLKKHQIINETRKIEKICIENRIDLCSIGTAHVPELIDLIPEIIKSSQMISASATIGDIKSGINYDASYAAAKTISHISKITENGLGNFRFAAIVNCPPHIPFFPASYHRGRTCFSIALECSDLITQAFERAKDLASAATGLKKIFSREFKKIANIGRHVEAKAGITFKGIDVSPAPSLLRSESIALAFEKLGIARFGGPGTIAIAGMITKTLNSINVKKCGYSGLMLPIMEDFGLARRWSEGCFGIQKLLAYSAVSGTGLDCVPLPGDISIKKIHAILLDMTTVAIKLNKPLSARLFPAPGKRSGEMTNIVSPYLINCRIITIE